MTNSNNLQQISKGRPTVITDVVVNQLEAIFKLSVTDKTACAYTGISRESYYNRLEKDDDFRDRMDKAKEYARIAAGQVVVREITENKNLQAAEWWLANKHSDEFNTKTNEIQPTNLTQINIGVLNADQRRDRITEIETRIAALETSGSNGEGQI